MKTKILAVVFFILGILGLYKNLGNYQPKELDVDPYYLHKPNIIIGISVIFILVGMTLWHTKKKRKNPY